jgi:uncharacterized RDD family membrane protein YckC
MRCPKCQYISFDNTERCRNCGYEFALAEEAPPEPELPLQRDTPLGPPVDLLLGEADRRLAEVPSAQAAGEPEPAHAGPKPAGHTPTGGPAAAARPADLPLFDRGGEPLVAATPPRPPLAVRRATPEIPRTRPHGPRDAAATARTAEDAAPHPTPAAEPDVRGAHAASIEPDESAPLPRRLIAGVIDAGLVAIIDFLVVYFTVRLCGLNFAQARQLPWIPLGAFLLLLDGGYFVMFTAAGGQTIGKMALGLRTVAEDGSRVRFTAAVARAAGYLVSALPAGAGFLACFIGSGRRALHDRLAGTRVVRSS